MSRTAGDYLLNFLCGHAGKYQFQTEFNGLLIYRFKSLRSITLDYFSNTICFHIAWLGEKGQITFFNFQGRFEAKEN